MKKYEYEAVLHEMPDNGGAYVIFPWDLRKEFGLTVIVVTHDMTLAQQSDRVIEMKDGKIIRKWSHNALPDESELQGRLRCNSWRTSS